MKVVVTGALGQDSMYMTELLLSKGYEVIGISRDIDDKRNINNIKLYNVDLLSKKEISEFIEYIKPDEIYNFASVSNVINPWDNIDYTFNLNGRLPQYILESIVGKKIKYFQASSCLVFGNDKSNLQNEFTPRNPLYPYGVAKLYADNLISEFRNKYDVFAVSGIYFNHESERRGLNFFTRKITSSIPKILKDKSIKIKLGNIDSLRDIGYAPDFMDASYKILSLDKPSDYVVGTGEMISMRDFLKKCFDVVSLDYLNHIEQDENLIRTNETNYLRADISKIKKDAGWEPSTPVDSIIEKMVKNDIELHGKFK
jgi:GDPmannose 4,6-dehydratase